jgi:hypothetical protein
VALPSAKLSVSADRTAVSTVPSDSAPLAKDCTCTQTVYGQWLRTWGVCTATSTILTRSALAVAGQMEPILQW